MVERESVMKDNWTVFWAVLGLVSLCIIVVGYVEVPH